MNFFKKDAHGFVKASYVPYVSDSVVRKKAVVIYIYVQCDQMRSDARLVIQNWQNK
jgi:hypothetical protein